MEVVASPGLRSNDANQELPVTMIAMAPTESQRSRVRRPFDAEFAHTPPQQPDRLRLPCENSLTRPFLATSDNHPSDQRD
jgi:hypothetical protein